MLEQSIEQLRHDFAVAGIDSLRRDFAERNKDECTLGETRMGNLQARFTDSKVSKQKDIQIERSGSVWNAGGTVAAKLPFDGQQRVKESARDKVCVKRDDGVGEARLLGEAYGFSGVERRARDNTAVRFEAKKRGSQCCRWRSGLAGKVGAHSDVGRVHSIKSTLSGGAQPETSAACFLVASFSENFSGWKH